MLLATCTELCPRTKHLNLRRSLRTVTPPRTSSQDVLLLTFVSMLPALPVFFQEPLEAFAARPEVLAVLEVADDFIATLAIKIHMNLLWTGHTHLVLPRRLGPRASLRLCT